MPSQKVGGFSSKYYSFGCLALSLAALVATFVNAGGYAWISGPVSAFFAAMAFLTFKYGYFIIPLVTKGLRVIEIRDDFEIIPSQEAIVKNIEGTYYASMFLLVKIYESTTEKTQEEMTIYTDYFERAITGIKYVVKFCMMIYVKDLTKYKEQIDTKRMEAQLKLQREMDKPAPDPLRIDKFERDKAMWEAQLKRVSSGVRPMGAMAYIMTTATGVSKDAAVAAVRAQATELRATLGNALNVEVIPISGEEMKQCFEWEYFIPPTAKALEEDAGV